jgi:hypothetical protein
MGSSWTLRIDDFEILSSKAEVYDEVMTIFRESDRRIVRRSVAEQYPCPEPSAAEREEFLFAHEYRVEVARVKDRLDLMGFGLGRMEVALRAELAEMERRAPGTYDSDYRLQPADYFEAIRAKSVGDWIEGLAQIFKKRLDQYRNKPGEPEFERQSPFVQHLLAAHSWGVEGVFPLEYRYLIRAFLEACHGAEYLVLDLTDKIAAGFYGADERLASDAVERLTRDYPANERVILLTEGSTDAAVLRQALPVVFPHLEDYFAFFEFEEQRAPGGVSALLATLKAFAGARIRNRVVAILDNDAAGYEALTRLLPPNLPSTIRPMVLPDIAVAERYPTVGPAGSSVMNVNGLACSIEMYLGAELLDPATGRHAVKWGGFNKAVDRYQGEVIGKREILAAFEQKAARSRVEPEFRRRADWEGMELIFRRILKVLDD